MLSRNLMFLRALPFMVIIYIANPTVNPPKALPHYWTFAGSLDMIPCNSWEPVLAPAHSTQLSLFWPSLLRCLRLSRIRKGLRSILKMSLADDGQWLQVSLPLRAGGLGIRWVSSCHRWHFPPSWLPLRALFHSSPTCQDVFTLPRILNHWHAVIFYF